MVVAAFGSAVPGRGLAQADPLADRIDGYLQPLEADRRFGGVVLVGSPERVRLVRSYGYADVATGRRATGDTRYRIASLTKTLTAAAIQILADRGRLHLHDTLSRFIPGFPAAERITIRHLLRHQSGVANPDYRESFEVRTDLAGLVARITSQPLQFEPGTGGRYSNAGFNLLAYVIERASGMSYADFLSREIFAPLGMRGTRTVHDLAVDPDHVRGYTPAPTPQGVVEPPQGDVGFATGSGDLSSTALDLYRWGVAVHRNQLHDLDAQIARDWLYGWGKGDIAGNRNVNQTGAVPGFMSSLAVFDDGTIVVVLLNVENGRWWRIANDLAAIVFQAPYDIPTRLPRYAPASGDLDRYPGGYTRDDHTLTIRNEGGHLWLYASGLPTGKWLAPIARHQFAIPADAGQIRFEAPGSDGFRTLVWDFGESESAYQRVPPRN